MQKRLLLGVAVVLVLGLGLAAGLYFSSPSSEPSSSGGSLETAQAQLDAGDFQAARATLEQIVASDAENAEAHFLLGLAHFNLQEYTKAEELFNRSMELDPDRAAAVHHNLGVLAYQLGNMDQAMQEFQTALEIDPSDPDTHYQLGATYLVMAFPMGAVEPDAEFLAQSEAEFERALDLSADKSEALVGLANVYMFQNKISDAIGLLEKAVEKNPDMREALFALGRAYAVSGQMDRARETLQHFLETKPPEVWAQQAQELLDQLGP